MLISLQIYNQHIGTLYIQNVVLDQNYLGHEVHTGWIYDIAFDSKKKLIVSCGEDGKIQLWSYQPVNRTPINKFQNTVSVKSLIYDIDVDRILAFDKEGNILVLQFSNLSLIKKIISNQKLEYIPIVDFKNNLLIGFSGNSMIIYDYAFLLRDHFIWCRKYSSIDSFAMTESEDIIFQRNDGYLHLWNTNNKFIEHLTFLTNSNSANSNIYFMENQQLIIIANVQALFLYDFKERKMIQTDLNGCDKSYIFEKQYIICINNATYSRISIKEDIDKNRNFSLIIDQCKILLQFKVNYPFGNMNFYFKNNFIQINVNIKNIFELITLKIIYLFYQIENDNIKGVISHLSSKNDYVFVYCTTGSNDLYIFDPIKNSAFKYLQNHHNTKILFLQAYEKYIITFDAKGIIKLIYGENFDKVEKIEDFQNSRVYKLVAFSQSIIYVKQYSSITPFRININKEKNLIITKGISLSVNCFGGNQKFYQNNLNIITMVCYNDLIYLFKITDNVKNNELKFEQIDLVRIYMLLPFRFLHSFFLTDYILTLQYETIQILLFLDNNFVVKKSNSNSFSTNQNLNQNDFKIVTLKQESKDKVKLIYIDWLGFKKQTWTLLDKITDNPEQDTCQFEDQYLSGTEASNLLNQISKSYSDFQIYLKIKKFNIIFNLSSSTKLFYTLDFGFKKTTDLKIKGQVTQDKQNPFIQIQLSKEFIDDCSQFNSFQLENIQIQQVNKDQVLIFNNFLKFNLVNIIFQDIISQRIIFNNTEFLLIQQLHINLIQSQSSSQQINVSQLQILNVKEVQIDMLEFTNCNIANRQDVAIIKIQNSTKVGISKSNFANNELTISLFFEIKYVEALSFTDLTISKNINSISDIAPKLYSLQYISKTNIENIEFSKNNNFTLMTYLNFIENLINKEYVTIRKAHDIVTLKRINFTENKSTISLMSIISTDVSLNSLNFSQNNISNSQLINFDKSQGIIQNSDFRFNRPQDSMIKISNSNLTIQDSLFMKNAVNKSLIEIISSNIYQLSSNFTNNTSEDDGCAMRVTNQKENFIKIINNKFQSNIAKGSGGSLYLIGYNITLRENKFIQNSAGIGEKFIEIFEFQINQYHFYYFTQFLINNKYFKGAIRYQKYIPIFMKKQDSYDTKRNLEQDTCGTFQNNQCLQNKAFVFGQNIGSNPRNGQLDYIIEFMRNDHLEFQKYSINLTDQYKEINDIRSGENKKLQIILFDENGGEIQIPNSIDDFSQNLKKELSDYKAQIYVLEKNLQIQNQQISIEGTDIKEYSQGGFKFDQILIKGVPGGQQKILLKINNIYQMSKDSNEIDLNNPIEFDIVMKFRNCIEGEVINQICQGCKMLECKQCESGTYSLVKPSQYDSNIQCKKCSPENTENCIYKTIELKKGYWRENEDSDEIVECINSYEQCHGTPNKGYCVKGYIGPLCETCDLRGEIWGKPYGKLK